MAVLSCIDARDGGCLRGESSPPATEAPQAPELSSWRGGAATINSSERRHETSSLVIGPDRTGRTIAVVDGLVATGAPRGTRTLPCPAGEIRAGAVCAHTHLYSGLARHGMPPPSPAPRSFLEILERVWWRLDRALDAAALRAAARDYLARALLAGTTTVVDHHESPRLIEGSLALLAEECQRLGMRAL